MGRITDRNGNGYISFIVEDKRIRVKDSAMLKIAEKLAHYEDLEEQGRLIQLPCKVGDKVYVIYDRNRIKEHMASRFLYVNDNEIYIKVRTNRGGFKTTLYKGNTFLTKEEAELKLKELKGE